MNDTSYHSIGNRCFSEWVYTVSYLWYNYDISNFIVSEFHMIFISLVEVFSLCVACFLLKIKAIIVDSLIFT